MSYNQSSSSLARTRSLRAPAATGKPALTAPTSAASAAASSAQIPMCSSNVLLFLTNLRLLDLDLDPEWPDITPSTFSAKDAAVGGQKKRIQCVEWALYRLFFMWDRSDAQNKLRPFFPPADQVQSINLRAALVRGLEAAKKNGVLGRDVLIRKTMLDECKGERLEEVLAVFSSAVLKKLVAERSLNSRLEYRQTVSECIALQNWGYTGNRTELNGLLLAHKASLKSILARKDAAREKYRNFEELLSMKERGIDRRRQQAESHAHDRLIELSDADNSQVRRTLRNTWTGNEQWVDGLLGGSTSQQSGLLSTPFDQVWSGVQAGNMTDLEEQTAGLLEQLEYRVESQNTRLKKWEDFRKSAFGIVPPRVKNDVSTKEREKETGFDFTAHLNIDLDAVNGSKHARFEHPPPEYAKLLYGLSRELDGAKSTKLPDFSQLNAGTRRIPSGNNIHHYTPQEQTAEPVSDLSEWEDESEEPVYHHKVNGSSKAGDSQPTAIPNNFAVPQRRLPAPRGYRKASPVRREDPAELSQRPRQPRVKPGFTQSENQPTSMEDNEFHINSRIESTQSRSSSPELPPSQTTRNDSMPPPPRSRSPTQALADEILDSMDTVSPSPVKKSRYTLTLDERTRMSMSRPSLACFEPEDITPQTSPTKGRKAQEDTSYATQEGLERGEEYEDLITRTRRSMAGFETAQKKAQLERRRSQKKSRAPPRKDSYFPRVEEEVVGDMSVAEDLMEAGQEDYEAIFKSRPRIALSPIPSPTKRWDED
ncbi:HAUS augmin-like complex subunit 6 N-terminus-domain-containing protein [Astrocystis sublimbata]|nr:HAUS augmin-like complex subunit 6 N-terminus-domain-containing protein [Astrocystis sublimbata]